MSLQRYQRAFQAIGGYSGGTSRLARPPMVLPERDIRPFNQHVCDMTLDFPKILVKMPDPDPVPEGTCADLSWAGDEGDYLAVAMGVSPWVAVYKRDGDSLGDRLTVPSPPTAGVGSVDWTPDGQYLVALNSSSASAHIWWSRSGDTLTRLTDFSGGANAQTQRWVRWSPDGIYCAVMHFGSSGGRVVKFFKRTGSTMAFLVEVSVFATPSTNTRFEWAPNGTHLVGTFSNGNCWCIKRTGDSFAQITPPPDLPGNIEIGPVAWSPDSSVVFLSSQDTAPTPDVAYITAHTLTGDTFGSAVNFSVSDQRISTIAMHPSGIALTAVYELGTNEVHVLERSGTALTDSGSAYPGNVPNDVAHRWTRSGVYVAIANSAGGTGDSTAAVDWWKARC